MNLNGQSRFELAGRKEYDERVKSDGVNRRVEWSTWFGVASEHGSQSRLETAGRRAVKSGSKGEVVSPHARVKRARLVSPTTVTRRSGTRRFCKLIDLVGSTVKVSRGGE